jgi:hypothetical protein
MVPGDVIINTEKAAVSVHVGVAPPGPSRNKVALEVATPLHPAWKLEPRALTSRVFASLRLLAEKNMSFPVAPLTSGSGPAKFPKSFPVTKIRVPLPAAISTLLFGMFAGVLSGTICRNVLS